MGSVGSVKLRSSRTSRTRRSSSSTSNSNSSSTNHRQPVLLPRELAPERAVQWAFEHGFDALADFLVEKGANRDARNDDGRTPHEGL